MLINRLYYRIKPYVSWQNRMRLRRILAHVQRRIYADTWPINEAAGIAPAHWPGWPGGKKFALVLSHDVESPAGLAKCRQLMQLDQTLGFRSSFNLIPEGEYRVPRELREELANNGFEVGVHDLRHDGKLFWHSGQFEENARSINGYLKEWGAHGFRSGFMLHDRKCLDELEIQYDSSTFDTDPFEPQPEGVHTIFPFWVSRPGGGYVELPYTLPQDSTLFLLLRETKNDLWIRKLDWVVKNGGMAFLDVHPDYIQFAGEASNEQTYDVALYSNFLKYIKERYAGQYWQALPREVASYVASTRRDQKRNKPIRVCMVTHSFYENDNRVTRYAEALAQRGDEVDVVALRRGPTVPAEELLSGVRVHRCQTRTGKNEQSKFSYLWPLIRFLATSSLWVARSHQRKPYDLLHIHNIPDFMVFAAWYPKLRGARVLLDIHDIVPEFYASKFGLSPASPVVGMLKEVERISASFADHVILANHMWLDKYTGRSAAPRKCSVFINNVDADIFQPQPRRRNDDKLIILFPGGLQWHQGLDIAINAFKQITHRLPNAEFHIYGDGNMKKDLVALTQKLELDGKVRFFEPLRIRQIAEIMANADLGVVPKRADSFGNEAYSTKIMEFMSVGIPVVVSSTKIDRFYFNDTVVRFFESGNSGALAAAMLEILSDRKLQENLVSNATQYVAQNNWEVRKQDYLSLVDALIDDGAVAADPGPTGKSTSQVQTKNKPEAVHVS